MSEIIEGLVGQFERGQLTRRELVLSLSALVLGGREAAGQSNVRAIPVSTLNHVTFRVSDVQRSVEFYQRIFGMPLMTTQGDAADPSLYVLRIGDGPQAIMLGQSATPDIDHFCLGMEGFDAERVTQTLAEHGVEASIRHRDDSDPPAQELMIRDPDGNGGVNPAAVEHMSQVLGGFGRIVWMPTYDAEAAVRSSRQDDRPFAAVSRNGELLPESQEVLALVARHDLVLATGHVSPDEGLLLVREARDAGVQHIVVTHALDTGWTVPQMQEAAEAGAFIEFAKPLGRLPIEQYVDTIRQVGPRVCIVSQAGVSHLPPELVGAFVVALVEHGFTEHELDLMMTHNPARLLGLPTP